MDPSPPPHLMVCLVAGATQVLPHKLSHLDVGTELTFFSKFYGTWKFLQNLWLNFWSPANFGCAKNVNQAEWYMLIVSPLQV